MRSRLCYRPQAGGARGCGRVLCQPAMVVKVLANDAQVLTTGDMVALCLPNETGGRVEGRLVGITVGGAEQGEFALLGLRLSAADGSIRDVEFREAAGAIAADGSNPAMLPGECDPLADLITSGSVAEFYYPRRFSHGSSLLTTLATFVGLAPKSGDLDVTRVAFRANGKLLAVYAYPWLLGIQSLGGSVICADLYGDYEDGDEDEVMFAPCPTDEPDDDPARMSDAHDDAGSSKTGDNRNDRDGLS